MNDKISISFLFLLMIFFKYSKVYMTLSITCSCAHLTALRRDSIGKAFYSMHILKFYSCQSFVFPITLNCFGVCILSCLDQSRATHHLLCFGHKFYKLVYLFQANTQLMMLGNSKIWKKLSQGNICNHLFSATAPRTYLSNTSKETGTLH